MNVPVCALLLLVTSLTLCHAQPGIYLAINALAYEDEAGNIVVKTKARVEKSLDELEEEEEANGTSKRSKLD